MSSYWWDQLTPEERAKWFVHTTPEDVIAGLAKMHREGYATSCTDPATLDRVVTIVTGGVAA